MTKQLAPSGTGLLRSWLGSNWHSLSFSIPRLRLIKWNKLVILSFWASVTVRWWRVTPSIHASWNESGRKIVTNARSQNGSKRFSWLAGSQPSPVSIYDRVVSYSPIKSSCSYFINWVCGERAGVQLFIHMFQLECIGRKNLKSSCILPLYCGSPMSSNHRAVHTASIWVVPP